MVDKRLKESKIQSWKNETDQMSKCLNYRMYKTEYMYQCDEHFSKLPLNLSIYVSRFRCMTHRLPIEFGRYTMLERKSGDLGDEFHYLFNCSHFKSERKKTIPLQYRKKPNMLKFQELMNTEDIPLLTKVATFCKTIFAFFDRVHRLCFCFQ